MASTPTAAPNGGLDPDGCAEAVAEVADKLGLAPAIGALYQVHYAGIPRVDCTIVSEPPATLLLNCVADGATLSWTDAGQSKCWVYRSTDGDMTYSWIGRTLGDTTFSDPAPVDGAMYQVHYAGIARRNCVPVG